MTDIKKKWQEIYICLTTSKYTYVCPYHHQNVKHFETLMCNKISFFKNIKVIKYYSQRSGMWTSNENILIIYGSPFDVWITSKIQSDSVTVKSCIWIEDIIKLLFDNIIKKYPAIVIKNIK